MFVIERPPLAQRNAQGASLACVASASAVAGGRCRRIWSLFLLASGEGGNSPPGLLHGWASPCGSALPRL